MVIGDVCVELRLVKRDNDYMVCDVDKLSKVFGFPVVEAGVVDNTTLVVYRWVPEELEGLVEDTYCYSCTL